MTTYEFVLNHILEDTDTSIPKVQFQHNMTLTGLPTKLDLRSFQIVLLQF